LFCFEDVIGEWRRLQDETADDSVSPDQGDAKRRKALESIIQDSRSPERDLILGDDDKAARITEIAETMPNFADVVAIIVGALKASQRGRLPLRLPPLLLVGPPGIGKTHFVNKIANAMQTMARSSSAARSRSPHKAQSNNSGQDQEDGHDIIQEPRCDEDQDASRQ
jgi:hypothetical protein